MEFIQNTIFFEMFELFSEMFDAFQNIESILVFWECFV